MAIAKTASTHGIHVQGGYRKWPFARAPGENLCTRKFPVRGGFNRDRGTKAIAFSDEFKVIGHGEGIEMGLQGPSV
eukprot:1772209-Pleurochrysis_carterae.AAC.2